MVRCNNVHLNAHTNLNVVLKLLGFRRILNYQKKINFQTFLNIYSIAPYNKHNNTTQTTKRRLEVFTTIIFRWVVLFQFGLKSYSSELNFLSTTDSVIAYFMHLHKCIISLGAASIYIEASLNISHWEWRIKIHSYADSITSSITHSLWLEYHV